MAEHRPRVRFDNVEAPGRIAEEVQTTQAHRLVDGRSMVVSRNYTRHSAGPVNGIAFDELKGISVGGVTSKEAESYLLWCNDVWFGFDDVDRNDVPAFMRGAQAGPVKCA